MISFLIPLAALLILAGLLLLFGHLQQLYSKKQALAHHDEYRAFMTQLQRLTDKVNGLVSLLPFVLMERKIVDVYESNLRMVTTVLTAARKVTQFGQEPDSLRRLSLVARSCEKQIDATYTMFKASIEAKQNSLRENWQLYIAGQAPAKGCYFCSKPFEKTEFKAIKTEIQGVAIRVWGCDVCRRELKETNSAKVLHFLVKGQPIHWELVSEYVPAKDFWTLNEKKIVYQRPKLELIRFDE